ncbi:MAG: ComEC family competence protein [Ruminococcaceae bacterium]|nr:ComEC family competence protein [Oscillospiraceae bacterium]
MFRLRPLALWITAFAAGILCAVFTEGIAKIALFAVIGVLCVLCFAVRRFPYKATVLPLALALIIGMGYLEVRSCITESRVSQSYGCKGEVIGDVTETDSYGFTLSVLTVSDNLLPKGTSVRVYYDYEKVIRAGDRVYCALELFDPDAEGYSYGTYVSASGDVLRVDKGKSATPLTKFRDLVNGVIQNRFSSESAGVAKAMLTGERTDMDPILYAAYRSSGIAHILVISGFHMSLLLMSAYFLLYSTKLGKRYAGLICIVLTLAFGVFVGFTPSVFRAAVMCIAVFAGGSFNYKNDSFTSLFTALGLLLILNPFSLFSVGLQLSFLCSLGIITLFPAIGAAVTKIKKRAFRFTVKRFSSVLISAVAALFSFPVVCYSFGAFSVISPVTNLFAIPVSSIGTVFGYLSFILPPVSHLADICFRLLNKIAVFFASFEFAAVSTKTAGMKTALVIAVISVIIIGSVKLKHRLPSFAICAACLALCIVTSVGVNAYADRTRLTVNSRFGKGCYQFVSSSGGECVFTDMGGAYVVTDDVFETGNTKVDVYIMYECDSYGMGNLCNILSAVRIDKIYINAKNRDPEIYERVLQLADRWNVKTEVFEENITVPAGKAYVTAGDVNLVEYGCDTFLPYGKNGIYYLDGRK